ncbi:MAG: COG2426 family protein [Clostridiaceae bacterium]
MDILKTMFLSAIPIIEQKGAIPFGIYVNNLNPLTAYFVSVLGSLIPVPFVLLLFNKIFSWMKKYKIFDKFNKFVERKINKGTKKVERFKGIGLVIFIAIPLPTTGLWTGSAIAAFLKIDFKKSLICAIIGSIICGGIVTLISIKAPAMLGY